jgi:homoserine acetyltransferase
MDSKLSRYGKKGYRNSYNCIFNPATNCIWTIGRKIITDDPKWDGGNYYGKEIPAQGLALARMVGHITYLSDASMQKKFGRVQQDEEGIDRSPNFQVESHLNHQGDTFTKRLTLIHIYILQNTWISSTFQGIGPS